jgi:signal transduction histidine kinase/CheY-like chemotaxis protein/HPt (histidine-containing phosphotransfer) domain-containing protein
VHPSASTFRLDSGQVRDGASGATSATDERIGRSMRWLQWTSWCLAVSVALLLPWLQWAQQARLLEGSLAVEAAQLANSLSMQASRKPDTWLYKLNALQSEISVVHDRGAVSAIRLYNPGGQELLAVGTWRTTFVRSMRSDIMDSGVRVAVIELQSNLRPAMVEALRGAVAGVLLGFLVWWSMARLALGGLRAAVKELQSTRDEARSANRAKGAFLAAMSHEIRTPMNGVLGMAELLAHSPLNEEQAQTVTTVRESAQSLLRIIDDILDFSKIEAGRLELESEPLLLTPLVEGACDTLAPLTAARGVQLWVCVEGGVPERVRGDAVRIRQVLTNLVGNAVKFSAGRSARSGVVEVRASAAAGGVSLLVRDNGIGMDDATIAGLFTPFTQAEASTTRRFGGTGLGLAISHRLVQMMGGRIEVTSAPGVGSSFSVWLPLVAAGDQPEAKTQELQQAQVLLVAEQGLPCADVGDWLRRAGAVVEVLPDVGSALARAGELPPPVVIIREAGSADPQPANDDPLGDIRQLVVGRGRRGAARLVSPTMATLDLLRRLPLLRAVAMLAGRASPEVQPAALDGVVRSRGMLPTVAQARAQGRLILVAEDDAVNRLVVQRQLALLGYAAEMADNGAAALRMWRAGGYALLLTDLHMPELDGYELAQAVREDEALHGRERQPILALTANALKGEAARARAAGIDDYLTKPASLKLLQAALAQWMPGGGAPAGSRHEGTASIPLADHQTLLNLQVLRDLVGDDEALIDELRVDFMQQCRADGGALHQAVLAGERLKIQAIAHRLKSAARSVGAMALGSLCERLEQAPASAPGRATQAQGEALLDMLQRTHAALESAQGSDAKGGAA